MVTWYRHYTLLILLHVLEVAIVGSAAAIMKSVRPDYDTRDVLAMIAVGMIAGAIYLLSITRLERHEQNRLETKRKSVDSRVHVLWVWDKTLPPNFKDSLGA